jgi:hypothetical protein
MSTFDYIVLRYRSFDSVDALQAQMDLHGREGYRFRATLDDGNILMEREQKPEDQ